MASPVESPFAVHLQDVAHSYVEGEATREVLHGIDLEVPAGDSVALLGRSGSGKSTLLNLIAGIDRATAGSVKVAGQEMTALGETERTVFRRRRIGMVFQAFHLVSMLTVLENVTLPLDLDGALDAVSRRRAEALLDSVGLADRFAAWPEQLSGGEQQRVAIARALVHEPEVVLADEPTGNLDTTTADSVLDLLLELGRGESRTLLMATHSQSSAQRCDAVLELRDGRLADGSN